MKVGLVDYGAGNLRSVANALRELGVGHAVVTDPAGLADCSHLVLPGVGSFGDCMARLAERRLVDAIRAWVGDGKPYFGICLGYQILFESGEESPGVSGLGLLRGTVRRFQESPGCKIPHMGWNAATPVTPGAGPWAGLGDDPYFYFVHSYFPQPVDESVIAARTTHGEDRFASAVETGSLFACQFHPEKSQDAGLTLMRNFLGGTQS